MTLYSFVAAVGVVLAVSGPVFAQESSGASVNTTPPAVDVDRLPLNLARLERQLQQSVTRENWDGFRLRYTVEVYGKAPRLQFFEPKDVLPTGPIPYGAPTHREMLDQVTPREYRSPAADFPALIRWLQEKLK